MSKRKIGNDKSSKNTMVDFREYILHSRHTYPFSSEYSIICLALLYMAPNKNTSDYMWDNNY